MLTGEIRNQVDRIWDAFWSGGISNPLEVIEQITYLLFLKRLDDLQTLEENKAARLKLKQLERRVFPKGKDGLGKHGGRPYEDLRWSRFKHFEAKEMYTVVSEHVFPFLRTLGGDDSTYAHHMKDSRFAGGTGRAVCLASASGVQGGVVTSRGCTTGLSIFNSGRSCLLIARTGQDLPLFVFRRRGRTPWRISDSQTRRRKTNSDAGLFPRIRPPSCGRGKAKGNAARVAGGTGRTLRLASASGVPGEL
jgi:hypothetical protein